MNDIVLKSYGIAWVKGSKAETVHIQLDGAEMALCGRRPVQFVGEVEAPDTEHWKHCGRCWQIAGPDVTEIWTDPGAVSHAT